MRSGEAVRYLQRQVELMGRPNSALVRGAVGHYFQLHVRQAGNRFGLRAGHFVGRAARGKRAGELELGVELHVRAQIAGGSDDVLQQLHFPLGLQVRRVVAVLRIGRQGYRDRASLGRRPACPTCTT